MARGGGGGAAELGRGGGGWKWCSYKRTTVVVCCINLVAALYVLRSLYTSFYIFSSSSSSSSSSSAAASSSSSSAYGASSSSADKFSDDQIRRMEESIRIRRAAQPIELVRLVKGLEEELSRKRRGLELSQPMKQELANELLQRLKSLKPDSNVTEQREALERWHVEKLEATRKMIAENATLYSTITPQQAEVLKRAIETDWLMLLEEIGLWIPSEVVNQQINDKPVDEQETEEEIIPGQPIPPECHAELHTDYDGAAVRWGLNHHKESATDCCQACLDQAKRAKPGEMKCNIWVYCPSESGCFSPDIYEHKHEECWLKQAEKPRLNFKDKYSESYRSSHPTAPLVVPWISGVVG